MDKDDEKVLASNMLALKTIFEKDVFPIHPPAFPVAANGMMLPLSKWKKRESMATKENVLNISKNIGKRLLSDEMYATNLREKLIKIESMCSFWLSDISKSNKMDEKTTNIINVLQEWRRLARFINDIMFVTLSNTSYIGLKTGCVGT